MLVKNSIYSAALSLGYSYEDVSDAIMNQDIDRTQIAVKNPLQDKNTDAEDDEKLKIIANGIVAEVMQKAVEIAREEKHKPNFREEERRLKSFALKFSMVIIGSAGKLLGYKDNEIIRALTRDATKRGSDRCIHPNVAVKFGSFNGLYTKREDDSTR